MARKARDYAAEYAQRKQREAARGQRRDYSAEYARRQEKARREGFKNLGQKRRSRAAQKRRVGGGAGQDDFTGERIGAHRNIRRGVGDLPGYNDNTVQRNAFGAGLNQLAVMQAADRDEIRARASEANASLSGEDEMSAREARAHALNKRFFYH